MTIIDKTENIYLIRNIVNDFTYVGKTSRGYTRLGEHIDQLLQGKHTRAQFLQKEFSEYGIDNFTKEIIMKTNEGRLSELVLIELFSRLGISYNNISGKGIEDVLRGKETIPAAVYRSIEAFLREQRPNEKDCKVALEMLQNIKVDFESGIDNKMYNKHVKHSFINSLNYNVNTRNEVRDLFRKTSTFEQESNKDLCNFTIEEAENLLCSLKYKTLRSLQNYLSKLNKYMEFAIEQGISQNTKNYYDKLGERVNISKFLNQDAQENMIFSKDEIMSMAENADNAQDGVILALLFDGLSFRDKYTELVELTRDMVDFDNRVINLPARIVEISDKTRLLIMRALEDDKYVSISGDSSRTYNIMQSNHVLRGVRKGREKINWRNINQRILRIAEINGEEFLNATNASYSGQVKQIEKCLIKGYSKDDAIDGVLNRFGMDVNSSSRFYLRKRFEKHLEMKNESGNNGRID